VRITHHGRSSQPSLILSSDYPRLLDEICAPIYWSRKGAKMTTITFERSGGVVGNEIDFDLDLESLPENEAKHIKKLIDNADFFNIPANIGMSATPDEFLYKITVDDGDAYHSVRTTDTTMPSSLLPLVREMTMRRVLSSKVATR
jgi:emfourin